MAKFVRRYHFDVREMFLLLGIFSTLSILMFTVGFMVGKTIDNRSKTLTILDLVHDPAAQKLLAESNDIPSNLLLGKEKFPQRKNGHFELPPNRQLASEGEHSAEQSSEHGGAAGEHGEGRSPQSEHLSAEHNVVGNKPLQNGHGPQIIEEPLLAKKRIAAAAAAEMAAAGSVPKGTEALFENLPQATPAEKEARKAALIGEGTKLKPTPNEKAPKMATPSHAAAAGLTPPAAVHGGPTAHDKTPTEKLPEAKKIKDAAQKESHDSKNKMEPKQAIAKNEKEGAHDKGTSNPVTAGAAAHHDNTIEKHAAGAASPTAITNGQKIPLELTSTAITSMNSQYTVQIGAYQEEKDALKRVEDLRANYAQAYYIPTNIPGKGKWYRVGIGFFNNRGAAEQFGESMATKGQVSGYIVRQMASIGQK